MAETASIIFGVLGFIVCVAFLIRGYISKRKKQLERIREKENADSGAKA